MVADHLRGRFPGIIGPGDPLWSYAFVEDVADGHVAALEQGRSGEAYNVCSGTGVRIGDLLERLIEIAGVEVDVQLDPERLRPADIPALVGDPSKLRAATGWSPRVGLDQTLRDLLDDWRERTRGVPQPAPRSAR